MDTAAFRAEHPYPWANPEKLLTDEGFDRLRGTLPGLALFQKSFGVKRKFGQHPHDRYTLEYQEGLDLSSAWRDFIAELKSERYRRALCRLLDQRRIALSLHWHYTPRGCSISPHCDAARKVGSQIFYFNTEEDWDPAWGGETLILDDRGRFDRRSAPKIEDFDEATPAEALGNRSLIFGRKGNSWHAMREIRCPEDHLRKVFIVVANGDRAFDRARALVTGRNASRY